MATTPVKTLALVILIPLIFLIGLRIGPFLWGPPGFLAGIKHTSPVEFLGWHFRTGLHPIPFSLFTLVMLGLWVSIVVWVYRDAEKRGMNGLLWALLVLIGFFAGLLIYLIVRSDVLSDATTDGGVKRACPECQGIVEPLFTFCPHCGTKLESACPECSEVVAPDWKVCPHCGSKLKRDQ